MVQCPMCKFFINRPYYKKVYVLLVSTLLKSDLHNRENIAVYSKYISDI